MSGVPVLATSESAQDVSPRIGIEKRCGRCKEIKLLTEFNSLGGKRPNEYQSRCKKCVCNEDPEKARARHQAWYYKNIERARETSRRWRSANKERCRKVNDAYNEKNRDKMLAWQHRANTTRRKNPMFKLSDHMGTRMGAALKSGKGGKSWKTMVSFTLQELRERLESLFQPGMAWENYGQWHVDHIRPVCSFNFNGPDDEDFKKCWSLDNLQPLWARDNKSKGGRWSNN